MQINRDDIFVFLKRYIYSLMDLADFKWKII